MTPCNELHHPAASNAAHRDEVAVLRETVRQRVKLQHPQVVGAVAALLRQLDKTTPQLGEARCCAQVTVRCGVAHDPSARAPMQCMNGTARLRDAQGYPARAAAGGGGHALMRGRMPVELRSDAESSLPAGSDFWHKCSRLLKLHLRGHRAWEKYQSLKARNLNSLKGGKAARAATQSVYLSLPVFWPPGTHLFRLASLSSRLSLKS